MSMTDGDVPEIGEDTAPRDTNPQPLYRIYEDSRIAVSKSVGKLWKNKIDAAKKAYLEVTDIWEQVLRYYNNNQTQTLITPRGVFKRGDTTENIVFSNLNVMLPAVYSKDPDITCSTVDEKDEPF